MENTLENSITIQNLILAMEELKKAKDRMDVKLAMLETNMMKEPMKCKPANPKKIQRWRASAHLGLVGCYGELFTCR